MNAYTAYCDGGNFGLDPAFNYSGQTGHRSDNQPFTFPQVDHFAAELDDFAQCILNNKNTRVSGEEGLRDVKVLEGIYESVRTGRAVKLG